MSDNATTSTNLAPWKLLLSVIGLIIAVVGSAVAIVHTSNEQWNEQRERDTARDTAQVARDTAQDEEIAELRSLWATQVQTLSRDLNDLNADLARMGASITRQIADAGSDRWHGTQTYRLMNELQRRNGNLDVPDPSDPDFQRSLKPEPFGPPPREP